MPNTGTIIYTTPQIDIGFPASFTPNLTYDALGTVTLEQRTGTAPLTSEVYGPISNVQGKRYSQFRMTVTGTTPYVRSLLVYLDAKMAEDLFEDISLAGTLPPGVEKIATGRFKVETRGLITRITTAQVAALQNVGVGWTWEVISKATTLSGRSAPAAEFKIYNGSGVLADAIVDISLRGVVGA